MVQTTDWFAVVGVSRLYQGQDLRLSYVFWQEGVRPIVVIELLSPGTQDEDLATSRYFPEVNLQSMVAQCLEAASERGTGVAMRELR